MRSTARNLGLFASILGGTGLRASARGGQLTLAAVPRGSGGRIGIDRDLDGVLNGDERDRSALAQTRDGRPMTRPSLSSLVFVALMVGCSPDHSSAGVGDPGTVGDPDARFRWQPLLGGLLGQSGPIALAFGQGIVIFNSIDEGLMAVDVSDWRTRPIVYDWGSDLWPEGDTLFFTQAGDQLFSVPIAGGISSLVLDGGQVHPLGSFHHLLDADYFYFSDERATSAGVVSFWRLRRAGGPATKLGEVPMLEFAQVALGADGVIVAGHGGVARVMPFDGGPPRSLAAVQPGGRRLFGIDATGAYWLGFQDSSGYQPPPILRSPVNGGQPEPFWATKPDRVQPMGIWPDFQGGWVVTAIELLDDGKKHFEVWLLDADQTGHLAALDPGSHLGLGATSPALSTDAVYVVVNYTDLETWAMVRVPR